jgi:glutamate carboxypeptidase
MATKRSALRERYRLEIKGEAGHPGNQQGVKSSALVELAQQILQLEGLNDPAAGLSVNVGRVSGGTTANVIPGEAVAEFEIRFSDQKQRDEIVDQIQALAKSPYQSSIKLKFTSGHSRPAMPRTSATVSLYLEVARSADRMQISLAEESRGGASDANLLAAAGLPTIDGLGPVGEMDHSENERILRDSLFQRVELLVHLLWDLRDWTPL